MGNRNTAHVKRTLSGTLGDEDIYGPPSDHDSDNSDASMQFEDPEDASSMNSAPTDLDDQYTYSSDPDGGEPG